MFLLFCLLFRCHEGSSVERFSLAKVVAYGPLILERPTLLVVWEGPISQDIAARMNKVSIEICRVCSVGKSHSASLVHRRLCWHQSSSQNALSMRPRLLIRDPLPANSGTLRLMRRDPVELEIFKNLYHSIAEEMGAALRRTAFSPNIKERRDYSCAVFDGSGRSDRDGRSHAGASRIDADVGARRDRCTARWSPAIW